MPISSILLGLALAVVVLPFVLQPFVRQAKRSPVSVGAAASATASKEATLVAVRDLDFDFQTGKVTEADYAPLRQQLLTVAAEAAQHEQPPAQHAQAQGEVDADIEAAVLALRHGKHGAGRSCPACGTPATAADKFCGACGSALDKACPSCAAGVQPGDRFCANCGAALSR